MENLAERLARLSPEKRASILNQLAQREQSGSARQAEREIVTGPVPLLPAQQKLLDMMATYRLNYHHYNMCIMLEIARPLNIELARQAIQHLMLHHDALRVRVHRDATGWRQWIEQPGEDVPLTIQDFSTLPVAEQKQAIEAAANQWQTSLNLTTGPVLRIVYFNLGSQRPGRLLFIVHHMASDAYSLRLLLEDFFTAYQQRAEDKPIQLPAKTSSIQQRAERMLAYARSSEIRAELDYWFSLPWQEAVPLPMDFPQEVTARPRPQELKIVWSVEETQALLRSIQYARNIQPRDVILTALASVLARWNGSRTHIFAMHHHGRTMPFDDLDFSHTVGWLSVHPNVVVRLPESEDLEDCIVAVSEQMKRMPNAGAGFELLRHATDDLALPKAFNALPGPNIVFNYLGQRRTSALFRQAQEAVGVQICLPNLWKSDLQMIFAEIVDNQLRFQWEYSETIYRRSTIEQLAAQLLETLRSLTR